MYEIKLGKELKIGDTAIVNSCREKITSISLGSGAGNDFGEYMTINGVWIYQNCPYVVEVE